MNKKLSGLHKVALYLVDLLAFVDKKLGSTVSSLQLVEHYNKHSTNNFLPVEGDAYGHG